MFHCLGQRAYVVWWSIDYASILLTILFGTMVYGRFTFHCLNQQQMFFFISVVGLCVSTFLSVLFVASDAVRTGSFFLYAAFANGVPFFYQIILKYYDQPPKPSFNVPDNFIIFWIAMLGLVMIGLIIRSLMIPERFFPGKCDFIFSSHQIWHIFINVGNLMSFFSWRSYLTFRDNTPCQSWWSLRQITKWLSFVKVSKQFKQLKDSTLLMYKSKFCIYSVERSTW